MMAKIDEQAKPISRRFQIIVNLSAMLIDQFRHSLDLQNDLVEQNEIGLVDQTQRPPFVTEIQFCLRLERNSLKLKFNCQARLVNRFDEPTAFLFVNLKARA